MKTKYFIQRNMTKFILKIKNIMNRKMIYTNKKCITIEKYNLKV